jgi:hypothetical protein
MPRDLMGVPCVGELHEDRIVAKGVWILLAIGLLTVVLLAFEIWYSLSAHANRNYGGRFKAIVIAVLTLVVAVVVAPYLWLVTWLLDLAWPYCERLAAGIDLGSGSSSAPWPSWLVWTLLTAATALVLILLWSGLRALLADYGRAVRLLGPKRAFLGTLLMCLLRLRLPRRDLFLQAPVISWVPWFALSAVLYSVISIAVFKWTLPLAVAALAVVMGLHVIAPPAWLFLGTSTYQSFAAFHALRQCWRRLGVTLLDRSNPDGTDSYYVQRRDHRWNRFFVDPTTPRSWSLRTRPELWEDSVWRLMDHVLVVVVDVRGDSDIVRSELDWLEQRGHVGKAWYLAAGENDVSPEDRLATHARYRQIEASRQARVVTGVLLCTSVLSPSGLQPAQGRD